MENNAAALDLDPEDRACVVHVENALRKLEGRWKMVILCRLFERSTWRFSELWRAIPRVSEKVLAQQLRDLERDGLVTRTVYPEVPPKVEYSLTPYGQATAPALEALLAWAQLRSAPGREVPSPPVVSVRSEGLTSR